ncbi:NADPH oxidase 5 [Sciurus carolinensis]|uniref:NADPH oxidase 5 n=1 Tax=Sciurus carolinensis TaxID=30640 RepID=A0AA41NJ74_SCICA|nr:NADPH oxidase 5 [Sciurus carolinensis]
MRTDARTGQASAPPLPQPPRRCGGEDRCPAPRALRWDGRPLTPFPFGPEVPGLVAQDVPVAWRSAADDAHEARSPSSCAVAMAFVRARVSDTTSAEEDAKWLQWVTQQFENIARKDREINLQEFKRALNVKEAILLCRAFLYPVRRGRKWHHHPGGAAGGARPLARSNPMDKLKFLFQEYNVDGSGSGDVDELRLVLQSCLRESAISLPEEKLDQLTLALFQAADKDCSGAITFDELREELPQFPGVVENLTIRPRPLISAYWHNHCNQLLCLATYTGLQVLLFALAASAHQALGTGIMVAKGCGQCLKFTCSFIAVLMLRRCLTWLRATWLAQVLPLDYAVQFHQLMGYTVVGLSLLHTVAHVVNFALLAQSGASPFRFWELLLTTRPGIGWVYGLASLTGVALLLLLLLMVVCSSPCVHRSGHFQVFYWTHLSYLPLWLLLIMHGPNFWKRLLVPGILFFLEKAGGLAQTRMAPLHIVEVNLLPSKVTQLLIKRPPLFHYKPGDYLYLNIPSTARSEWPPLHHQQCAERHSSSPHSSRTRPGPAADLVQAGGLERGAEQDQRESCLQTAPSEMGQSCKLCPNGVARAVTAALEDTIRLHIRSQGQWMNRLYESFKVSDPVGCDFKKLSRSLRMRRSQRRGQISELSSENHRFCNIKCYIDGPYGTSTRRIFASEHAVLIGAGIGITPFASVLQSIMHRHKRRKHVFPSCQHSWMDGVQDHDMKLHKVNFIWINRDQRSFEWFASLLTKLEMDQAQEAQDGFLFL